MNPEQTTNQSAGVEAGSNSGAPEISGSVPTSIPVPTPAPAPSAVIRTYESDVADAVKQRHSSLASISIAENAKQSENPAFKGGVIKNSNATNETGSGHFFKKLFYVLLSLILIGGGAWGGYYFYSKSILATKPVTDTKPKAISSIFTADSQKLIDLTSVSAEQLTIFVNNEDIGTGKITEIIFTKQVEGGKVRATPQEFFTKTRLAIPDNLSRSLTSTWMAGVYRGADGGENLPFAIFTTDFFQNTFASMLKWEPSMAESIVSIIPVRKTVSPNATTSTSTDISSYFAIRGSFSNSVLKSKDVRSFKDNNGNIIFVYSFFDEKTLVIAKNEDTLREILTRIEKRTYIR